VTNTIRERLIARPSSEPQDLVADLVSARPGPDDTQPVDDATALTQFLRQHVQQFMSVDADSLPECPRCYSVRVCVCACEKKGLCEAEYRPAVVLHSSFLAKYAVPLFL